jgi:hypothetical protein
VFLPTELQLGSVTTYPTDVIGEAAHEAKFSPDGSLLVRDRVFKNQQAIHRWKNASVDSSCKLQGFLYQQL